MQWPSLNATSTCTVASAANGALEGGISRFKYYGSGGDHVGGHAEAAARKWSKLAVTEKQVAISPSFWDVRMWPSLGDLGVGSGRGKQEASVQSGLYNHSEPAAQQGDPRVRGEVHHQNVKDDSSEFHDITFSNPVHVECSDKSGGKTTSFLNVKRTHKREIPCKREFRNFLGQRGLKSPERVQGHHSGTVDLERIGGGSDQHGCAGDAADLDVEGGRNKAGKDDQVAQPVLLMLNTDFAVTSPVRENLLLTIALTQRGSPKVDEAGHEVVAESSETRSSRVQLQVLVGQFKAFSSFLRFRLGADALRVKFEQNAGGSSTISESLSMEYFSRRFQARDVVTEMEVEYRCMNWKKVDYICTLYGERVGVSVTRAMSYPNPAAFTPIEAYRLLYKKLFGLVVARDGVKKKHSFQRCILHVWCETQRTAEIMETKYKGVLEELDITDDVIMVLTVAEGPQARPIFYKNTLNKVT